MSKTLLEYRQIIQCCKALFEKKSKDYHSSWRILRLPSCTDQILIKAQRIRTLQEKKVQKIGDTIESELIGIINYSIIALIQLQLPASTPLDIPYAQVVKNYDAVVAEAQGLLEKKNHDYGEIWRDMRVSSLVDIILMKLMRIKQIEDNAGKTLVSEGVKGGYQDMINYAVFALIQQGFLVEKKR